MAEDSCDIYDNLPAFKYDETIEKLYSLVNNLNKQIKELKVKLSESLKEKSELETKCSSLAKNMSSLYKTATAEIQRKDKMLSDLRVRLDDERKRTRIRSPPCKRKRTVENSRGHRGRSDDSKTHNGSHNDSNRRSTNSYTSPKRKSLDSHREISSRLENPRESATEFSTKKVLNKPHEVTKNIEPQAATTLPNLKRDEGINKIEKTQDKIVTSRAPNFHLPNVYTRRMFKKIYGSDLEQPAVGEKACTTPIFSPSKSDTKQVPFAENSKEKHANPTNETPNLNSCPKENKENLIKSASKLDRSNYLINKKRTIWFEESSRESIKFETVVSKSESKSPRAEGKVNTKSPKKKIEPIRSKKDTEKEANISKKAVELFGSPVKWTEDSMEPIDLPPTVYEDSCSAQIESNLKNVKDNFVKPVTPAFKIRTHSIFSPCRSSQSSESFAFPEKQPDKKVSTRQMTVEDSLIGQFETTTQFITSLTEVEGKISPLSTPSKSNQNTILDKDSKTGLKLKQVINKNGEQELIYVHSPRKNPRTYNSNSNSNSNDSPKKDSTNSKCSISESFFHLKEKNLLSLEEKLHKINSKVQQTSNFKRPVQKSEPKDEKETKQEKVITIEPMKWVLYPIDVSEYKGRGKWDWNNSNQNKNILSECPPAPSDSIRTSSIKEKSPSLNLRIPSAKPGIVIGTQRRPNFGRKTTVDNFL